MPLHDLSHSRVMRREFNEIPFRVETQLAQHGEAYRACGRWLKQKAPRFMTTCARGSSDFAALYLKYLVELRIGIVVASVGPSVASLYHARLKAEDSVSFAISQSGGSTDIAQLHQSLQTGRAAGIALINASNSKLGKVSQQVLPIGAGEELALPATKSFVCSLVAIASIVAAWSDDPELAIALEALPNALASALSAKPDGRFDALRSSDSAFVIGRGPTLAVAREAALKLQETAFVHAEAFSAAEVLHGPAALVKDGFACLVFPSQDQAGDEVNDTASKLKKMGARIINMEVKEAPITHPLLLPLIQIARFYVLVEDFAQSRGTNPDQSRNLQKITNTV